MVVCSCVTVIKEKEKNKNKKEERESEHYKNRFANGYSTFLFLLIFFSFFSLFFTVIGGILVPQVNIFFVSLLFRCGHQGAGNSKHSFILKFKFSLMKTFSNKSMIVIVIVMIEFFFVSSQLLDNSPKGLFLWFYGKC